jgi:uncharacterized protein YbgA (DUF1722 family)/uncharacterized protein YbbK (DUF523 family)
MSTRERRGSAAGDEPIAGNPEPGTRTPNPEPRTPNPRAIRIGVSACLLGEEVRFDGGHKREPFLTDTLGAQVEFVSVCPEVEMGLGTPRETLRLVRVDDRASPLRMITTRTGIDHTDGMKRWSAKRLDELARNEPDLCGYVLKKDSPSCGMERVKTYSDRGMPERNGRGLFAAALIECFPLLPVEEEGRLNDPRLRENFIERVFAYRRLKDLFAGHWSLGGLVAFHTAHKMALLAHSTTRYSELGRLVARGRELPRRELRAAYESGFMDTLKIVATTRRHTNVLTHMMGHLKKQLDSASKQELVKTIEDYRLGLVPLVVPLTLLRHHVRVHGIAYLAGQTYLEPHPRELMLRNHV